MTRSGAHRPTGPLETPAPLVCLKPNWLNQTAPRFHVFISYDSLTEVPSPRFVPPLGEATRKDGGGSKNAQFNQASALLQAPITVTKDMPHAQNKGFPSNHGCCL